MGERCTGACCRRFWLPFSTRAEVAASGDVDAHQIADMVIPLKDQTIGPDGDPLIVQRGLFFTCKNLQANGDCGIYETRPKMCRDFPNGYRCSAGNLCEWDGNRALPVHPNRPSRALRRDMAQTAARQQGRYQSPQLEHWKRAEAPLSPKAEALSDRIRDLVRKVLG